MPNLETVVFTNWFFLGSETFWTFLAHNLVSATCRSYGQKLALFHVSCKKTRVSHFRQNLFITDFSKIIIMIICRVDLTFEVLDRVRDLAFQSEKPLTNFLFFQRTLPYKVKIFWSFQYCTDSWDIIPVYQQCLFCHLAILLLRLQQWMPRPGKPTLRQIERLSSTAFS